MFVEAFAAVCSDSLARRGENGEHRDVLGFFFFSNVFCFQTSAAASALISVDEPDAISLNRKKSQEHAACQLV